MCNVRRAGAIRIDERGPAGETGRDEAISVKQCMRHAPMEQRKTEEPGEAFVITSLGRNLQNCDDVWPAIWYTMMFG